MAIWMNSDGDPVTDSNVVFSVISSSDTTAMAMLVFPSLLTSQDALYFCTGSVLSLGNIATEVETFDLVVDCKFEEF